MHQANRFEQSQMNFLWDVLEDEFKYLLVAWDIVCSSIEVGLGIRKVGSFKQAILGKWIGVFFWA